jgi:hypothetical protein
VVVDVVVVPRRTSGGGCVLIFLITSLPSVSVSVLNVVDVVVVVVQGSGLPSASGSTVESHQLLAVHSVPEVDPHLHSLSFSVAPLVFTHRGAVKQRAE